MVMITLYARQQKRHRCIEQSFGLCGRGRGGMIWENGIEICITSYMKRVASKKKKKNKKKKQNLEHKKMTAIQRWFLQHGIHSHRHLHDKLHVGLCGYKEGNDTSPALGAPDLGRV